MLQIRFIPLLIAADVASTLPGIDAGGKTKDRRSHRVPQLGMR